MTRGRTPGSGSAQARILDVLRGLGTDHSGLPVSIRSADLAARAKVNHHSLAKCTGALLALGQITRCLVQPAKGNKTFEFRIGPGIASESKPLDPRHAGIAKPTHRSTTGTIKPLPKTTPPKAPAHAFAPLGNPDDGALLRKVQTMSEAEFGEFVGHLARVWSWGRGRKSA